MEWRFAREHTCAVGTLSPEGLEAALRAIGRERFHDLHPFRDMLQDGKLNKGQGPGPGACLRRHSARRGPARLNR